VLTPPRALARSAHSCDLRIGGDKRRHRRRHLQSDDVEVFTRLVPCWYRKAIRTSLLATAQVTTFACRRVSIERIRSGDVRSHSTSSICRSRYRLRLRAGEPDAPVIFTMSDVALPQGSYFPLTSSFVRRVTADRPFSTISCQSLETTTCLDSLTRVLTV
jgi:hypothetical protein